MTTAKPTFQAQLRRVSDGELVQGESRGFSFPRHHHDSYTIGLVTAGREIITSRGAEHRLSRGALYFSNPAEAHDGRAVDSDGWSFSSFYVPLSMMARLSAANEPLFQRLLIEDAKLSAHFARLFAVLTTSLCRLEIESAVVSLIGLTLSRNAAAPASPQRGRARAKLKRVQDYIDAHHADDIALADLAVVAGIHPRHLIAAFKDHAGITPHAYLTTRRVNAAYLAISGGTPIAQAAIKCGFYDQSHLHRHFKRQMGVTPDAVARAFKR